MEHYVEHLVNVLATTWGIDPDTSRNHLGPLLKRMSGRPDAEVEQALDRAALELRKSTLGPILKDLDNWLRGQLAHLRARLDDAAGEAMTEVLRYWKPHWATPEGRQHLRAFACIVARQRAGKVGPADPVRDGQALDKDPPVAPPDPERLAIEAVEEQQRRIAASKLRDLNWLLQALTPAEAGAVIRGLGSDPTAGLTSRQIAAWRRAHHRARERLKQQRAELGKDRRRHRRTPADYAVLVRGHGLNHTFRVIDESAGGIGLEGEEDSAALELGVDYMVRVSSDSSVLVRGARCVRIERTAGGFRFGLQFHFQHPLSPQPCRRARRAQVSL